MPAVQPPAPRRPVAFDVRDAGGHYLVCPECIRDLQFADSIADPVFRVPEDGPVACEECGEVFEP